MSAINFPDNPIDGQYFVIDNLVYRYDLTTNSWSPAGTEASDSVRLYFGPMPPAPASNNIWWNTDTAEMYVYYQDGSSSQWVISTPTPTAGYTGSRGSEGFVGSQGLLGYTGSEGVGFTGSAGIDGYIGSAGVDGYVGSRGSGGFTGSAGFLGSRGYTGSAAPPVENFIVSGVSTGTITADIGITNVIEVSPTGAFNIDIAATGRIFTNGTTNIIIVINQGATAYVPTILLDGGSVNVAWQGGAAPNGTPNKTDIVSLTVFRSAMGYRVFGQLVSFG